MKNEKQEQTQFNFHNGRWGVWWQGVISKGKWSKIYVWRMEASEVEKA